MCSKFQNKDTQKKISYTIGGILILRVILIDPYQIYLGSWNIQSSLPLQLCSLSAILSGLILPIILIKDV